MLDLELLRSFVSVVDSGGFTRAGERVHRTQSTVSQQIKRLEDDLGQPLLNRTGKDVTPRSRRTAAILCATVIVARGGSPRRIGGTEQGRRGAPRHPRGFCGLSPDKIAGEFFPLAPRAAARRPRRSEHLSAARSGTR